MPKKNTVPQSGPYQEKEGPEAARSLLIDEELSDAEVDRICYIIGHHHTFNKIDGKDFQILWEADMLEALKKIAHKLDSNRVEDAISKNFKTEYGVKLAKNTLLTRIC